MNLRRLLPAALLAAASLLPAPSATAGGPNPYIADVMIFSADWAPRGWAKCDGQLLPIAQNTALFSLIGCTFGGDCRTTFALPDLRGRSVMGVGSGPGLTPEVWGEKGGAETVNLTISEMASHSHSVRVTNADETKMDPNGNVIGMTPVPVFASGSANLAFNSGTIANTGGNIPVQIRQPYLALNYVMALQGIFPSRN